MPNILPPPHTHTHTYMSEIPAVERHILESVLQDVPHPSTASLLHTQQLRDHPINCKKVM